MKVVYFTVLLLVLWISSGEALRCNRCVPRKIGGSCTKREETCSSPFDVCARVRFTTPQRDSHFTRCMSKADASKLKIVDNVQVDTCSTDLCN